MSTPPSRTQKRQRQKEGAQARRAAELAAARKQQRTRRIVRVAIFAVIAAALVLAMSVFGGKDKKDDTAASSSSTTEATTPTTAARAVKPPTCTGPDGSNTDLTKKPTVPVPDKKASELSCRDLVVGTGKEVKPGDTVTVQYVGVAQSSGKQFDASWDTDKPFTTSLSSVIPGWTNGIPGMKVGGRRMLIIPGDQAYGAQANPPKWGADDTLIFVVDVQDTKSA
jgi:peptidylprolyl isomerase